MTQELVFPDPELWLPDSPENGSFVEIVEFLKRTAELHFEQLREIARILNQQRKMVRFYTSFYGKFGYGYEGVRGSEGDWTGKGLCGTHTSILGRALQRLYPDFAVKSAITQYFLPPSMNSESLSFNDRFGHQIIKVESDEGFLASIDFTYNQYDASRKLGAPMIIFSHPEFCSTYPVWSDIRPIEDSGSPWIFPDNSQSPYGITVTKVEGYVDELCNLF